MSKAVLVMDMPSSCDKCNFQQCGICHAVRKSICGTPTDLKSKPDWCPLKPMPEKKDICGTYNSEYYAKGGMMPSTKMGYNACIDEILNN